MVDRRVPPAPRRLFSLLGTPVQADLSAPLSVVWTVGLCWVLSGERYPERSLFLRGVVTALWTGLFFTVFFLHSVGHIVSARAAGAPMDTLLINAIHWITLYNDESVEPSAHIGRAMGGPLANLGGIALAGWLRALVPTGPFGRDLLDAFMLFNVLIGGAGMLPTPTFDGGTLLKWSVYRQTGDLARSSRAVRRAGLVASLGLGGAAGIALLLRRALAGTIMAAFSLVTALESLRRD